MISLTYEFSKLTTHLTVLKGQLHAIKFDIQQISVK